eukprot:TRINITY_DN15097_c0_g1_i1.p1 TRINITY_DN15097_c0_g1~~TRINITY_DN15097_c0_g1_i1.p1  ORF type:complete len:154 (-),score=29.19 TRINITY_DN15097_c0_g1_i1:35-496(-)
MDDSTRYYLISDGDGGGVVWGICFNSYESAKEFLDACVVEEKSIKNDSPVPLLNTLLKKMKDASDSNLDVWMNSEAAQASTQKKLSSIARKIQNFQERKRDDSRLCMICMDAEKQIVFSPCGHLVACVECAQQLKSCPMCRKDIADRVRVFSV